MTFLPYFMKSSRNALQSLREPSPSMSSTLLSMTSLEIFLGGEQCLVAHLDFVMATSCISRALRNAQSNIMKRIYNRTTPEEQKWIVRIILKGGAPMSQQVLLEISMASHLRSRHLSQGDYRLLCFSSRRP